MPEWGESDIQSSPAARVFRGLSGVAIRSIETMSSFPQLGPSLGLVPVFDLYDFDIRRV